VLETMTPMGRFFTEMNPENEKNYVGFAGGSGITPIMSILKTVLQVEPKSSFTLFYGNRGFDSIIFRETIEALKNEHMSRLTVHHIFSDEKLEGELFNGFITVEKCQKFARYLFDIKSIDEYFICGPEPMMLAIRDALQSLGVDNKKIHIELFTTPGQKQDFGLPKPGSSPIDPKKESHVTVLLDGDSFDFTLAYGAESVLDGALKQGADLPFACKGGVCATCKARLLEGEVEMEVNYALEEDELKAGYILTCQSHPRSEKLVVDYDH
jgi:ring-1,2-phenylacetyl-CoA epoxidase subunit PaaE